MPDTSFSVFPRYSPGSPGMVNWTLAASIAEDELRGYENARSGIYGPEKQARADRLGLSGIVESITEIRGKFEIHDLITGETFVKTPAGRKLQLDARRENNAHV